MRIKGNPRVIRGLLIIITKYHGLIVIHGWGGISVGFAVCFFSLIYAVPDLSVPLLLHACQIPLLKLHQRVLLPLGFFFFFFF